MKKFASDLWLGLRTGPARAGLALFSLALGLFAVTILLSTFDALQRQAKELVQAFGAGSFVLIRSASSPEATAWNRRQVEYFRENLGDAAWVSGVKLLDSPVGADFAVAAADADLAFECADGNGGCRATTRSAVLSTTEITGGFPLPDGSGSTLPT